MSKANTFENELLLLIFNNTNIALIGDATGLRGSSVPGFLYVALHTANPDEAGSQVTNECAYAGYARVAVARSPAGFTVTGNSVSPTDTLSFPPCSAGTELATHFSVGVASSGASKILYKGTVTPNIAISTGVTPQLTPASTITED